MISKETIEKIKNILIQTYNPKEIYIFGSYAWGNPSEESDLDLLIVVDESNEPRHKRPVEGYLALFELGIPKDLIIYTKDEFDAAADKTWTLARRVKKEGKRIYARS